MLALRIAYTALAMTAVVSLLATGRPLGGLVLVPLAAVALRRAAESGLVRRVAASRVHRP